jgi:hypothetical protein
VKQHTIFFIRKIIIAAGLSLHASPRYSPMSDCPFVKSAADEAISLPTAAIKLEYI